MAANPMRWFDREMPDLLTDGPDGGGPVHRSQPEDVAFVNNVSAGRVGGRPIAALNPGDEMLSTDHAYGAVSSAMDRLCRPHRRHPGRCQGPRRQHRRGSGRHLRRATARNAPPSSSSTRSRRPTARRFPIEAVAALAHRFGAAVLVDAAHAPGHAPARSPQARGRFLGWQPAQVGLRAGGYGGALGGPALAATDAGADGVVGRGGRFPYILRAGRYRRPLSLGGGPRVPATCWRRWAGTGSGQHNEALVRAGQATVAEILGSPPGELRHDPGLSMALVPLPPGVADTREQTQAIKADMAKRGVEMSIGCWNGQGRIRLSAQVYNRPADYERLGFGVRDLLAG